MSSPFRTKEFFKLKSKWDKKLVKSGFKDIEQDEEHLKLWSSHFFKVNYNKTQFEAKEDYYRLASQFLYEHLFKNELELKIWKFHSEGTSIRDISALLRKKGTKVHRNGVHTIVKSLCKAMLQKYKING